MSVILTACRHSKQRAIAKALKKRAEKHRLKKEAELMQLEAYNPAEDAITKCWTFLYEGTPFTVVLYLATDKDTVDIYCNEEEVADVMTNVSGGGITFDFVMGYHKARISCIGNPLEGLVHKLSVNGYPVPDSP